MAVFTGLIKNNNNFPFMFLKTNNPALTHLLDIASFLIITEP